MRADIQIWVIQTRKVTTLKWTTNSLYIFSRISAATIAFEFLTNFQERKTLTIQATKSNKFIMTPKLSSSSLTTVFFLASLAFAEDADSPSLRAGQGVYQSVPYSNLTPMERSRFEDEDYLMTDGTYKSHFQSYSEIARDNDGNDTSRTKSLRGGSKSGKCSSKSSKSDAGSS